METAFALGAGPALVGIDQTSIYPAAVTLLPKVGYVRTLSGEGLLSLRPSLVLASADAGPPAALQQVARQRSRWSRCPKRTRPKRRWGGAVATAGIVGFVGLVVPHLVRLVSLGHAMSGCCRGQRCLGPRCCCWRRR